MPENVPGDPPSRWTVINDYSKTVVTLAAALLGFIATFSDKLQLAQAPHSSQNGLLMWAIAFLVLSIGSALAVPAMLDRYLRICAAGPPTPPAVALAAPAPGGVRDLDYVTQDVWDRRPRIIRWCKIAANLSYFTLFVAAVLLAFFARARLLNPVPQRDEAVALSEATHLLGPFSGIAQPQWTVQSLTYLNQTDNYEVLVLEETTKSRFKVTVPRGGAPLSAQKL
jgi:hypothetical protein